MTRFNTREEAVTIHKYQHGYSAGRKLHFTLGNENFTMHRSRINWLLEQIPEHSILLDIGCSAGEFIEYIQAKTSSHCVGIDVNPEAIAVAKSNGIMAHEALAEELPFDSNIFNVILLSEVLEHLYNPDECLKESYRVLKPNGIVIGSVPHCDSIIIKDKPADKYLFHMRDFTRTMLEGYLSKYFINITIKEVRLKLADKGESPFWFVFKGVKK